MSGVVVNDQDAFTCPVCLDLLKEPVTIPCGHSYCMVCIRGCWDTNQRGEHFCPQCRQTFSPRPFLNKNIILAEMVEQMKSRVNTPAAGPGDVACDMCTAKKLKAIKSCLVCLASYCETHLQPHYQSPALKTHKLVKATKRLQQQICSQHQKPLEVYCHTDQRCICILCTMGEHKIHKTETAAESRNGKQKELQNTYAKFLQRINESEADAKKLRDAMESYKCSADAAVEGVELIFTELTSFLESKRAEVTEMIRAQERTGMEEAEALLEEMEQEIAELKKRKTEIEEFLQTQDHIHFLQSFQPLSQTPESKSSLTFTLSPHNTFVDVIKSANELKEQLEEFSQLTTDRIAKEAEAVDLLKKPQPKTREDFLQYYCPLTLDPNTINRQLSLSENNKELTFSKEDHWYPDHPERFIEYEQVLCVESLAGRCYWEVEWSGKQGVSIALTYKWIERAFSDSLFGRNSKSWRLKLSEKQWQFWHGDCKTDVLKVPDCSKIGVYLDYNAGTLSFYSLSNMMSLIHRVQTLFKYPLHAGFKLNRDTTLRICDL